MPKRWGKQTDEDHAGSEGDSEGVAPPARKTQKKDTEDSDGITVCDISKTRRVSVRNWQGNVVVDIREFYFKDGKQLPGKKEIYINFCLIRKKPHISLTSSMPFFLIFCIILTKIASRASYLLKIRRDQVKVLGHQVRYW
ncbi:hypothetical protein AMTRI_Chr11g99500 [Amborella trichopoda]